MFVFAGNLSAQTKQKTPAKETKVKSDLPKITQVDEITVKELFKPKAENPKPLLVNFWATWCVPCREEFPDLVKIDEEFRGKIEFITISLDDLAEMNREVPQFLAEMKAKMPAFLLYTMKENEVIGAISKDWSGGLPFTVLYNEKREVVFTKQGKVEPEILTSIINETLQKTSAKIEANP
jgi:thiol-disulfide isomerase/thioredoxin